jgi:hypothetical protein
MALVFPSDAAGAHRWKPPKFSKITSILASGASSGSMEMAAVKLASSPGQAHASKRSATPFNQYHKFEEVSLEDGDKMLAEFDARQKAAGAR